jgi:hypothetical protein
MMSRAAGPEGSKVAGDNNAQSALALRGVQGRSGAGTSW